MKNNNYIEYDNHLAEADEIIMSLNDDFFNDLRSEKIPCWSCQDLYRVEDMYLDNEMNDYICESCVQKSEYEDDPTRFQCENCGKYFDLKQKNEIYGNEYESGDWVCDSCYEEINEDEEQPRYNPFDTRKYR